jgi:hypothetical protein
MAGENGKPKAKPEDEAAKPRVDLSRYSLVVDGPWTEADDVWLECMTGEYDRRIQREAVERELNESDL